MDYHAQMELNKKVDEAKQAGINAKNLMEAVARRHAELDGKLELLNGRLKLLEEILAPEIEAKNKQVVNGEVTQKKGFFSRLVGS